MKEPKSPLPWNIIDVTKKPDYYDSMGSYEVTCNTTKSWNTVMDDQSYYNQAPELGDAEYIVQAANNFPEAIRLLKECVESMRIEFYDDLELQGKLNQFLTKLEEDEKDK
jgi:hypothetical protein